MAFWVFVLVNATLFIRPSEVVPALDKLPIYNVLIVICLGSLIRKILDAARSGIAQDNADHGLRGRLVRMLLLSNLVRLDFALAKRQASTSSRWCSTT